MHDIEFVDADTGQIIGTALRERTAPPTVGSAVTLEHAFHGPLRYLVVQPADHWYRARSGRLAKIDQYVGVAVRVYLRAAEDQR